MHVFKRNFFLINNQAKLKCEVDFIIVQNKLFMLLKILQNFPLTVFFIFFFLWQTTELAKLFKI